MELIPLIYKYYDPEYILKYSSKEPLGRERYIGAGLPSGDQEHYEEIPAFSLTIAELFNILTFELPCSEVEDIVKYLPGKIMKLYRTWLEGASARPYIKEVIRTQRPRFSPRKDNRPKRMVKPLSMERDGVNRDEEAVYEPDDNDGMD